MRTSKIDPQKFRGVLIRNTVLPLGLATILCGAFVGLILLLVSVSEQAVRSNQIIARAHLALQRQIDAETGLRGFIITQNNAFLEPYTWSQEHLNGDLTQLDQRVTKNPQQIENLRKIRQAHLEWGNYASQLLELRGKPAAMRDQVTSQAGKKIMDAIRGYFDEFIRSEEATRDQHNQDTQNSVRIVLFLIVAGSLITGAFLAYYSRKQLNEVSSIYRDALEKEANQNEILTKEAWLKAAQADLANLLRGEQSIARVCSEVLGLLCETLDAKVGAFYLVDSSNHLNLHASYALSAADEKRNSQFRLGDTLVGQAVRDKKLLAIDPAPSGYLKISSSLGEATAQSILLAPAIANNSVQAVIELGFLRPLKTRDQELVQLLSENIGNAIVSAQYRIKLQDLLEESQKLTEELQTQQEELRVNNEELEEQARALQTSQARLEGQQTEMEQVNSQLAQQNDELSRIRISLEQKAKDLERASEYKSQFLANMSHELRTPLNSTLILAQLLLENKSNHLDPEETEYARTILSSSNDLLALINDILDLAKIESGKLEIRPESVEVSPLVQNIERLFKQTAERKSIELHAELDPKRTGNFPPVPATIFVDKQKVEQILKNLISNAIKFTVRGSVNLRVFMQNEKQIAFEVTDTGIGIPTDKHRLIFEAFQQADGTTSRNFGGTGLGLSISRDLSRLLGGEIQVKSTPGKGSSFCLVIPVQTPAAVAKPLTPTYSHTHSTNFGADTRNRPSEKTASPLRSTFPDDRRTLEKNRRRLMIVEDDKNFAKILLDLGREHNFQGIVAQTAEEAIDMAGQFFPNAIILDINLPDHNGLFVLDRLKTNPATRHIPVHIVSAEDYSVTALQMGAIGYQTKPVDRTRLATVIQKLESKMTQDFKKVLIIEDDEVQRESLTRLISAPGVEVVAVGNGQAALELLQKSDVDCVVLDLSLPDMSGYEVLERMTTQKLPHYPPVIIYTARSLTSSEEERLQNYSKAIILKGAKSPERLLSEISLFLHQVETKMPSEQQKVLQNLRDRERSLEGRTVLIVDDDVRNIFALNSALHPRGAITEIARNGKEALAKLAANPKIEIVLMDLMMPEMDGYEAMREIRKNPQFKNLPIIAVTAKAMLDDQEKCMEAGASDYLAKPIDLAKLLSLIRVWLKQN
jgi:CheY-like chemotaxis protein/signal transduction histidine kinase/CHASE3 domain sensor protein